MRERFGALRERPFRLLFLGQAVSLLGDGMVGVALAFAMLDLPGSATDLGIVLASRTVRSSPSCSSAEMTGSARSRPCRSGF